MSKFNTGDTVKVVNSGACYGHYKDMARAMGGEIESLFDYKAGNHCRDGEVFIVEAVKEHLDEPGRILYGLKAALLGTTKSRVVIIGERGIQLIKAAEKTPAQIAEDERFNGGNLVALAKDIIARDTELAALRKEVEELRAFKLAVVELTKPV